MIYYRRKGDCVVQTFSFHDLLGYILAAVLRADFNVAVHQSRVNNCSFYESCRFKGKKLQCSVSYLIQNLQVPARAVCKAKYIILVIDKAAVRYIIQWSGWRMQC